MSQNQAAYTLITFLIAFCLSVPSWGTVPCAQRPSDFEKELCASIRNSSLSYTQKVQHAFNRFGYGHNPLGQRTSTLFKQFPNHTTNGPATDEAIIDYVRGALGRRNKTNPHVQDRVNELYPAAGWSYADISTRIRNLFLPFQELKNRINMMIDAGQVVPPALEAELVQRSADIHVLRATLIAAEQGEQLMYAILDNNPMFWILLDFWFNHFNVAADKVIFDLSAYRDALGAHMFGSFEDLLLTTARHPAMMIYLDNYLSRGITNRWGVTEKINENYGREVMELHTLGRGPSQNSNDLEYNQNDVIQASRILTGWGVITLDGLQRRFNFDPANHIPGTKTVMGKTYPEGEIGGRLLLRDLAQHPLTARNISRKLVRRFVSEDLRELTTLIERLEATFLQTNGNLVLMYQTLFSSPDFWSAKAFRSKAKTPLTFVASALRATGMGRSNTGRPVIDYGLRKMDSMGQRILFYQFPTGFPDDSRLWATSAIVPHTTEYGYQIAGYKNMNPQAYWSYYRPREDYARAHLYTPDAARVATTGQMIEVFDLLGLNTRFRLPASIYGDGGAFEALSFNPDYVNRLAMPVRTLFGGFLGSADFMKY